jgi:hypothetical protein
VLTQTDLTVIEEIVTRVTTKVTTEVATKVVNEAINHAFATHPRLARMEKRDGRLQRSINYLVEAFDAPDRWQRQAADTLKDHELRLHRLERRA